MRHAPPHATRRSTALRLLALAACAGPGVAWATPAEPAPPAAVVEEKPVFATMGWKRPAEARPGCVAGAVKAPADLAGQLEVTAKFAVAPDGYVDRFEDVSTPAAPEAVAAAVSAAVRSCAFTPGLDPDRKPAYVWLLLPVKVGKPAAKALPAKAQAAADPKAVKVAPVALSRDQAAAAPGGPTLPAPKKKPARK